MNTLLAILKITDARHVTSYWQADCTCTHTAVKRLSMREKLYTRQLCLFQNTGREGNGDLISDNNELIVKNNHRLRELNISPLDAFRLLALTDALPLEWREGLKTISYIEDEPF